MSEYAKPIDITTSTELRRLAAQVKATRQPVPLTEDDEIVAVVQPAPRRRAKRVPSKTDLEAFRASAGSWKDHLDLDQFLRDNEQSRSIAPRPPVEL
jgi:hypothetical protein